MPETIGQRLQQARLARRLSLEQVAEDTRIRLPYLQALEADDYSALPSAVHGRGFLRNYATYLGLDFAELLALQATSQQPEEIRGPLPRLGAASPPVPVAPAPASSPSRLASFLTRWLARRPPAAPSAEGGSPASTAENEPLSPASAQADTVPRSDKARRGRKPAKPASPNTEEDRAEKTPDGQNPPPLPPEASQPEAAGVDSAPPGAAQSGADPAQIPEKNESSPTEPADLSAEEILRQIGQELRQRRELLSLTLEEVERHVHIRAAFLQALEDGADDLLPAPVQTRGMLANYAAFLDLNVDALLLRYAEALQIRHRQRHPYRFRPRKGLAPLRSTLPLLRSFIAGDLLFGLGMVVMLGALAIWGLGRLFASPPGQSPLPTAPSIPQVLAEMVAPTLTQEVTLIPAADTPLPTQETPLATLETPTLPVNVNVLVNIVALERTFMRVFVDGKLAFEGRVTPGSVYPFEALSQVAVLTGNGAALRVTYNGQDMGLLGGVGEVVNVLYTVSGVMTPTLTPSPTATLTPVVTPSRTPTITPVPSATRTPSPTPTIRP